MCFCVHKVVLPTQVGTNNSELIIFFLAKKEQSNTNYEIGKRLSIRLTEEEKKMINSYAKADGLTVSDYIKNVALKNRYIAKRIEYQTDLREFNFEIHKIGVNINQLARHVNRGEKFKTIDSG